MPESTVLALAGVLGVPIVQVLKGILGLSGAKMLWVSFILSFVIMLVTALVTHAFGGSIQTIFSNPDEFFKAAAIVFSASTLFYGSIKEKAALGGK